METKNNIRIIDLENKIDALNEELDNYKAVLKDIKSKEELNNAFLYSSDSVVIGDKKGQIIDCNYAIIRLSGYPKDELLKMNISQLFSRKTLSKNPLSYNILKNGKNLISERLLKHKNGSEIPIEMNSNMLPDNNYITIVRDIRERNKLENFLVETEHQFYIMVENSVEGILLINEEQIIIYCNLKLSKILGYSVDELKGTNFEKYLTKESIDIVKSRFHARLKGEAVENRCIFSIKRKDGEERQIEAAISIYTGADGKLYTIGQYNDVTEDYNRERQLQISEKRFRSIVENSHNGIGIIDDNYTYVYANEELSKVFNYKIEEIVGSNFKKFLTSDSLALAVDRYERRQKGEKVPNKYELKIKRPSGEIRFVEISSNIIKKFDGKIESIVQLRDISEWKKEQEEIKEVNAELLSREITLRAIFDNSIAAIYVQNKDGIFIDINKGAEEMYGYSKEELIGKDPSFLSAEGKNDLSNIQNLFKKAFNGEAQQFEFWGKRINGEIFPKLVNISKGTYFDEDVIFAFSTDITEHKKRENIQDILYNISKAGANNSMMQFAEYIQKELGKVINTTNFYIALYNQSDDTFSFPYYSDEKDYFTNISAKDTLSKYVMETRVPLLADIKTKNKLIKKGIIQQKGTLSKVWMGAPLISSGEIIGIIAIQNYKSEKAYDKNDLQLFSFVSEQIGQLIQRKKQEEELKVALNKAEESDRLKSAFLANMSHEIRTPMNGILGFTSLLKENIIGKNEQIEAFDIIEKSGNRLLGIINDLIDISKIEAKQIKLNITEYNIYHQLKELYNFFKLESQQHNLKFTLNVDKNLRNIDIKSDDHKMHAIFTNLIKNAIKYTPQGEIEFGYEIMSNHLRFYVKDSGIGVAKDRQKAIFERFIQADIEDREAMEGAGLGLAITKAYVEMLGGEIWLKSTINKGSTFYFSIPFNHMKSETLRQQIENDAKNQINIEDINNDVINILIAEDDNVSFYYIKTLLKFKNIRITRAINGFEAVSIMEMNPDIDLILMDIKMPRMDGHEATKLIRKFNTKVIIIAQTANAMAADKVLSLEAGCNDYISKPIFKDVFYQVIEDNLKRKLG